MGSVREELAEKCREEAPLAEKSREEAPRRFNLVKGRL